MLMESWRPCSVVAMWAVQKWKARGMTESTSLRCLGTLMHVESITLTLQKCGRRGKHSIQDSD